MGQSRPFGIAAPIPEDAVEPSREDRWGLGYATEAAEGRAVARSGYRPRRDSRGKLKRSLPTHT